jgi:hypothetical protein
MNNDGVNRFGVIAVRYSRSNVTMNCCRTVVERMVDGLVSLRVVGMADMLYVVLSRVGSRKVSRVFLRERDFSRDQPCETRLLARLESRMVSRE